MSRNHCGCRGKCNCQKPRQIVYPVREEVKHCHTEERVQHIHPSHTTVVNHHTIKNEHLYPHSTSCENRVNEVDVRGAYERPGNEVRGAYGGKCDGRVGGVRDNKCCGRRRRGWW
ncbi:CotD family spore coat protein [Pseudogracilibacillus auburnensis]|uniref:Inner spore coat protein D n=1 Tax=Pseudogracilibacillus auburnensis TaxID=1494959 RepID=A0A2V3W8K7_9BACI|nr:CotD family spore coat protein [Pseudogracilibacillus auburnensis]MBO1001584.1 spore coat protein [Pseudogracilibacillus auburnensis]PXW89494.1 inner spore coat protein D [Pseudogracilibacillus auburnensis]